MHLSVWHGAMHDHTCGKAMNLFARISGRHKRQESHPVFGSLLHFTDKRGSYWEAEPLLRGDPISVAIEIAGAELPSEAQALFYERLTADPDIVFAKAAPLLVPEYEKWSHRPFPDNWHTAFRFAGLSIPVAGSEFKPWELSFDCLTDRAGHMFTCYFIDGKPSYVTIDG